MEMMDSSFSRAKSSNLSLTSEVTLFSEVLKFQQIDPTIVEGLLEHPLAEGYLQVRCYTSSITTVSLKVLLRTQVTTF